MPPRKKKFKHDFSVAEQWAQGFKQNKALLHLDISHNNLDSREIQIMRQGLDLNHHLLGLHTAGNEGTTDALGFFNEFDQDNCVDYEDIAKHAVFTRIRPNLEPGAKRNQEAIRLQATSNCWICEGWTEFQFDYEADEWVDLVMVPVQLHVSCDNYKGEVLDVDENKTAELNARLKGS